MLENLKRLFFTIKKDLKIIFRSWSSLFLLIIGPLLLILIVGFAFSGEELHDVNIGICAKDFDAVEDITVQLSSDQVVLYKFKNFSECLASMKLDIMDLCAEFSEDFEIREFGAGEIPVGTIIFYYDNTRYNLAKDIVAYVNFKIRKGSEEVTLESTKIILSNIEESVEFMRQTKITVAQFKEDGKQIRKDLADLRDLIIDVNSRFDPSYKRIKELQKTINEDVTLLNSSKEDIIFAIDDLNTNAIPLLEEITAFGDLSFLGINLSLPSNNSVAILSLAVNSFKTQLENNLSSYFEIVDNLNAVIVELDKVNNFLNQSLEKTNENIEKLDYSLAEIDKISKKLDETIDKFAGLGAEEAGTILRPITTVFQPLLEGKGKVELIFPILLVFVISFISILLSNIMVLNETHSPAYFRTFLIPIESIVFILGLFITNMIVILFQVGVLLVVAFFKFNIDFSAIYFPLILAITLVAIIFVLIGMIIGYLIKSEQTSILTSTFLALAIFFFSDVIFPLKVMPPLASLIASYNPLVIGEAIFRKIVFFSIPLEMQLIPVSILIVFIAILAFLVILAHSISRRKA